MIGNCPRCKNHEWNMEVNGNSIACPNCGYEWEFKKLPLFILTGASGVGKTTTAQKLQRSTEDFIVMDADMFYNLMPHETENDYFVQVEQLQYFSRNMMQCGKPVVWAKAGNIDMFARTYGSRFFSHIYCLALVCTEDELRKRMSEGRGITDSGWIQGSVDYNQYFQTHNAIEDVAYDILRTDDKSIDQVAEEVCTWIKERC